MHKISTNKRLSKKLHNLLRRKVIDANCNIDKRVLAIEQHLDSLNTKKKIKSKKFTVSVKTTNPKQLWYINNKPLDFNIRFKPSSIIKLEQKQKDTETKLLNAPTGRHEIFQIESELLANKIKTVKWLKLDKRVYSPPRRYQKLVHNRNRQHQLERRMLYTTNFTDIVASWPKSKLYVQNKVIKRATEERRLRKMLNLEYNACRIKTGIFPGKPAKQIPIIITPKRRTRPITNKYKLAA
jgi:hypothetical protein